ncbi:MAG: ATP-binding protein [candidate division Zixibacteria bacterium]|nr:ATP-binding protein [candidate division Zixibacteria bacterium]
MGWFKKKNPEFYGHYGASLFYRAFLLFGVIGITFVFVTYTQDVILRLKEEETQNVEVYARLYQALINPEASTSDIDLIFETIIQKARFPMVFSDSAGNPQNWRLLDKSLDTVTAKTPEVLAKVKRAMEVMDRHRPPREIRYQGQLVLLFHYGDPPIVNRLRWMPYVELALVAVFIVSGYVGFRNLKRSEQRHIWVGMAKETAHQLGTPLSSLMGWVEVLRDRAGKGEISPASIQDVAGRMEADLKRLEKVANRFGQIGSMPELKAADLNGVLTESVNYFKQRLPHQGNGAVIRENLVSLPPVEVNAELFGWVIENLIKNALEAVDPKLGVIEISTGIEPSGKAVWIQVADNGRGVPSGVQKRIFNPGFTTKKRGWGLGLTLAKRIVEEYHKGKLFLEESMPNVRTAFKISLPVGNAK